MLISLFAAARMRTQSVPTEAGCGMRCSLWFGLISWSYRAPKGLIFQTISEWRMQEKIMTDDSGAEALDTSVSTYRTPLNAPRSEPIDTVVAVY